MNISAQSHYACYMALGIVCQPRLKRGRSMTSFMGFPVSPICLLPILPSVLLCNLKYENRYINCFQLGLLHDHLFGKSRPFRFNRASFVNFVHLCIYLFFFWFQGRGMRCD